jgi:hypothetical protein
MARSGWKTAGLIAGAGCLSIIAIIIGGGIIATMYARATVRSLGDPNPQSVERRIALSPPPAERTHRGRKARPAGPRRCVCGSSCRKGRSPSSPGRPAPSYRFRAGSRPALFELTESHSTDPTGAREARVRFHSKAPAWARFFAGIGNGNEDGPQLTITIPRGTPIDLTLQVSVGRSQIDLGGLTLGDVSVTATMGEHRLDFREPVVENVRELRFSNSMGNLSLEHIGNARPETINATGSMGNVTADLAGAWSPGSESNLRFDQSMGDLTVRVPSNVRVNADVRSSQGGESTNRTPTLKQSDDPKAPMLRLHVTSSMGNARVIQD